MHFAITLAVTIYKAMNFDWKTITEQGQYEHGFVDIFLTTIEGRKAYVIINYLPQFNDKDQKVLTTLLLEGEKTFWTEGRVKWILHDCEDRVKDVSNFKFRVFNKLDYMTIQTLFIPKIEDLNLGTSGDFGFE
ncbi:hypothetical protein GCM10009122_56340 [Fulvivirga kasyanovii]|uniref:hypothetical protein n=1 Tax=Fulvivirga kasyanovii TaxID=396812 RepID=UPI0031DE35AA